MEHIDDTSIITPDSQQNFPPKTWLVESVLVTVFCCQILGIIGIINAASVESKFYRGDIQCSKASKLAKQMVIWSVISWVIIVAIVVAFYVFAIVLSATTGEWK